MSIYNYKVIDHTGKQITSVIEGSSENDAVDKLVKSGYTIISVKEKSDEPDQEKFGVLTKLDNYFIMTSPVSIEDLVQFTNQMANMLAAGMTLTKVFATLKEQTNNKKLKMILPKIMANLQGGQTLSDSLGKYPEVFSKLYVNMIAAGEASGSLDEILLRLSIFMEKEAELKQKISSAMAYPFVLIGAGVVVIIGLMVTVIPQFVKVFIEAEVPLPLPTQIVWNISNFFTSNLIYIFAIVFALWFGVVTSSKTEKGKYFSDSIKMKLPAVGDLLRKISMSRLTKTISILMASGLPIMRVLEIAALTVDVGPITRAVEQVSLAVTKGRSLSGAMSDHRDVFFPMVINMVGVGEETGNLELMLNKVSENYEMESSYALKKLLSLIEPAFLIVLGAFVFVIVASVILPVFSLAKAIK